MQIYLLIALTDRSGMLQLAQSPLTFEQRNYERGSSTARLYDPADSFRPEVGESYDIWIGDSTASPPISPYKIWAGQIESTTERRFATAAEPSYIDITAVGWAYVLDRRRVRGINNNGAVYRGKTPRQIVNDLITVQLTGESLTLHSDPTATGSTDYTTTLSVDTFTYGSAPTFPLQDGQAVKFTDGGSTVYYVRDSSGTDFKLAATIGGVAIDFSPASGAETVSTVIDLLVFDHCTFSDALNQLAALCSYVWWVDENIALHFVPSSLATAAFDLDDTSHNFRNMAISRLRQDYRNTQFIRIGFGNSPWTAEITGDGSTQEWEVGQYDNARTPYSWYLASITEVAVNGVVKTLGTYGVDTGTDFYWRLGDTKVYQDPAATPLPITDTLRVRYWEIGADIQYAELAAEISTRAGIEGGTGIYDALEEDTASLDPVGAVNLARGMLSVSGQIQVAASYETDTNGLRPGAVQNIDIAAFGGISADFVINSIRAVSVDGKFFRYQVEGIATVTPKKGNAVDFFKALGGSGGGGGISGSGGGVASGGSGLSGIETMAPSGGHIAPVLGANFTHQITLTGNVTLDAPGTAIAGHVFCVRLIQDGTGGRTVTFDAFYTGLSGFALDTTGSTYASLIFQVNTAGTSAALIQIAMNGNPVA